MRHSPASAVSPPAALWAVWSAVLLGLSGCGGQPAASGGPGLASPPPADDQLRQMLDHVLQFTFDERRLNLRDHAAWQILHGVLAYQNRFVVEDQDGRLRPVVPYLLDGGAMKGWVFEPGVWLDKQAGRRGLRALLQPGSKAGQGHADQWLAILAQCGLPPDQTIVVDGHAYTIADWVAQVQWDLPENTAREYSWTLIGLTTYLPTDATWPASDGTTWGVERLMAIELEQDLDASACGGTHRLIGLAMALNQHLQQGGALDGVWRRADEAIQRSLQRARQLQNPDGSLSSRYFAGPGQSPDLAQVLETTGHTLELLAVAMTAEQLEAPWVKATVARLCHVFRQTRRLELECGALYHAAHGLMLYRTRKFGPPPLRGPALRTDTTAARESEGRELRGRGINEARELMRQGNGMAGELHGRGI